MTAEDKTIMMDEAIEIIEEMKKKGATQHYAM